MRNGNERKSGKMNAAEQLGGYMRNGDERKRWEKKKWMWYRILK